MKYTHDTTFAAEFPCIILHNRFLEAITLEVIYVECQLKMTNLQGEQAPAKQRKIFRKFENSSTKTVAEQTMSSQTPLGSFMEFARRSEQNI
jgi:hypothetical protein